VFARLSNETPRDTGKAFGVISSVGGIAEFPLFWQNDFSAWAIA